MKMDWTVQSIFPCRTAILKMKRFAWFLFVLFVAGGVVAGGVVWYRLEHRQVGAVAPSAAPAKKRPAVPVETAPVRIGTVTRTITAIGTLQSDESVIVRPEIAGRIVEINFKEGVAVRKGATLLRLDDSIYEAEIKRAQAALALSRKNFERADNLHRKGVGSARKRDETLAQLRVDEAQVELAMTMLDKTRIRAPFGGIVGLREVSVGDYVSPGHDLVNLESIHLLKVDFQIPQTVLTTATPGQPIGVRVDAFPGREFPGQVLAIDPMVDVRTRSVAVRGLIPNSDRLLRPGLFVTVELPVERREGAILVPEESVLSVGGDQFVYRVVDGRARIAKVALGRRRSGEVEVTDGLGAADTVVTAGHQKLRDGAPVMAVDTTQGAKP